MKNILFCVNLIFIFVFFSIQSKANNLISIDDDLYQIYFNNANDFFKNQKYDLAIKYYDTALTIKKNDAEVFFKKAISEYRLKIYDDAFKDIYKSIELNNSKAKYYLNLGNFYLDLDKTDSALKYYYITIEKDPGYDWAYGNIASIFQKMENYNTALFYFDKAINFKYCDPEILLRRAKLNYKMERYDEVINDVTNFLKEKSNKGARLLRVQSYINLSRNEEALEDLSEFIRLNPQDSLTYHQISANIHQNMKDFKFAELDLKRCSELDTSNIEIHYKIAKNYYFNKDNFNALLFLNKFINHPNYSDSINSKKTTIIFAKSKYVVNMNSAVFNLKAKIEMDSENYIQSLFDCNKAIECDSNNFNALNLKAEIYTKLNKNDEALKIYNKLIEKNLNDVFSLIYRATIFTEQKKYKEAWQDYKLALNIDTLNPTIFMSMSHLYADLKQYDSAIINIDKAIALSKSKFAFHYYFKGEFLFKVDSIEEAKKCFLKAIELDSKYYLAYAQLAFCKYKDKDFWGSINDYSKCIEINPKFKSAYDNRGYSKYELKDFDGALEDYNYALKLDSNFANAYDNRALIYKEKKDYKKAINDLDKAILLDSNLADAYLNRGEIYFIKNNYQFAMEDLNKCIQLESKNAKAYFVRAKLNKKLGQIENACADLKNAKLYDSKSEYYIFYLKCNDN